jgi:hypothetical protein
MSKRRDALRLLEESAGQSITEIAVQIAGSVGVTRFISCRDRLELSMRGFPVQAVMLDTAQDVDVERLAQIAVAKSDVTLDVALLATQIRDERAGLDDLLPYVNGHDLSSAIAGILKHLGVSKSPKHVAEVLRSTVTCEVLKATNLFRELAAWAASRDTRVLNCV